MNIIYRAVSLDSADNGLSVVVHKEHGQYLLRYEPCCAWDEAYYHDCAVISVHDTPESAYAATRQWQEQTV